MENRNYGSLFKYRTLDDHFHEMVREANLFFPNRHQLNDPDEAVIRFDRQKTISEEVLREDPLAPFVIQAIEPVYVGVDDYYFFCLSRKNNDIPMWSHYGNMHRGVCVEFDFSSCSRRFLDPDQEHLPWFIDFDQAISISEVSYKKILQTYALEPNGKDPAMDFEEIELFGYSKLSCWENESEVRLRIRSGPQKRGFPKDILKAVYFGLRVDSTTREETARELQSAGYSCRFFKAVNIAVVELRPVIVFEQCFHM